MSDDDELDDDEPDYEELYERWIDKGIPDGEQWLWCLHCERFFQAKDLRPDVVGGNEGCAFSDCDGAGLSVDIFIWDDWASQHPDELKHWPKSTKDLHKGLLCPLYP